MQEQSLKAGSSTLVPQFAVLAAALLAVTLWGGTPIATKIAVSGMTPLAVGLLRTLLAALIAAPFLIVFRLLPPRSLRGRSYLGASALCGYVLFPLLFSIGMARTTASHGALLIALAPIFTGLIAAVFERRRPGGRWWLGSAIAATGTVMLVSGRLGLSATGVSLAGDLWVITAYFAGALSYVTGARAAREAGTWAVTFWNSALGGIVVLPLLPFVTSLAELAVTDTVTWAAVGYLALISSIVAYAAWYWALSVGDTGRTGTIQFFQPVTGLLLAVVILGEVITLPLLLAAAVIMAGVVLARSGANRN